MDPLLITVAGITGAFVALLAAKQYLPYGKQICAMCVGVSLTWTVLLAAYWTGRFAHPELVTLLMGSTVLGLLYEIEDRLTKDMAVFRLPLYLTLLGVAYTGVTLHVSLSSVIALGTVWIVFGTLYLYREHAAARRHVEKIIACCKDW